MKVINKRVHVMDSKPALRIEIELPLSLDGFQTTNSDFAASFVQAVKDYEDSKQDVVSFADDVPILARLRYGVEFLESLTSYDIEAAADEIERLREALQKWWSYSQTDYDDHIQMMIDWDDAVTSTRSALQQKESE